MQKLLSIVISFILIFLLIQPISVQTAKQNASAFSSNTVDETDPVLSEYIITFLNKEQGANDVLNLGVTIKKTFSYISAVLVDNLEEQEIQSLEQNPNVISVEKNEIVRSMEANQSMKPVQDAELMPTDEQETVSSTNERLGTGVKVAVLDTGIKDNSTAIQVVGGVSFVAEETHYSDLNGHGTFVASLIAANEMGTAPGAELYAVKVLNQAGIGTYSQVIEGVEWALTQGIDIVSMGFTGRVYSTAMDQMMTLAYEQGLLLVAPTGNEGTNEVLYPAKYDSVIAVGAVDENHDLAIFSNTGSEVELVAPGVNVQGIELTDTIGVKSGTSFAAPQVTGALAALKSKWNEWTNIQLREQIIQHADSLSVTRNELFGYGVVNLERALASEVEEGDSNDPQTNEFVSNFSALLKPTFSSLNEQEKQFVLQMYEVSEQTLMNDEQLGFSLIDSITIETRVVDYGLTREEVQALLEEHEDLKTLDSRMAAFRVFTDHYVIDESRLEEIRQLFIQGYESQYIHAAYVVSQVLSMPVSDLIVEHDTEIANELLIYSEILSVEDYLILSGIVERLPIQLELFVQYVVNAEMLWEEVEALILSMLQAVQPEGAVPGSAEGRMTMAATVPEPLDIHYEKYIQAPFSIQQNLQESIQPGTGNLAYKINNYSLPGRNGMDVNLSVTYDSADSNLFETDYSYSSSSYTDYDYVVFGWALAYYNVAGIGEGRWSYYDIDEHIIGIYETSAEAQTAVSTYASNYDYYPDFDGEGVDLFREYYAMAVEVYDPDGSYFTESRANLTLPDTYIEKRYNLGAGWSFDFPSIEKDSHGNQYFHTGGSKHKITITSATGDSNLEKYTLKDIRLETDNGSYKNTQNMASAYVVYYNQGYKEYFSADGRLLAQMDRYDNTISYEHVTINGTSVISKIIDSMDREILFQYSTGSASKTLTITLPNEETIQYVSELIPGYSNEYTLSQIIQSHEDESGANAPREMSFEYDTDFCEGNFSYFSKTSRTEENLFACLTEITFPTAAKTVYSYEKAEANLGNTGSYEYYRIKSREDLSDSVSINKLTYSYEGNYSGYPAHSDPGALPDTYTYAMGITDLNNKVVTYTLSNKHLIQGMEIKDDDQTIQAVNYLYNTDKLPVTITTTQYNIGTNIHASKSESMVYDAWGNVIEYTDPLSHVTLYSYDPVYQIMTSETRQMNASTTQQTVRTVDPETGNIVQIKQRHFVDGMDKSILTDMLYDSYGNVTTVQTKQQDGTYVSNHFEYGSAYDDAYLTRSYQHVTDVHGNTELIELKYAYDRDTGLVRFITDGEQNTSELQYDDLGRLRFYIHPNTIDQVQMVYDDSNNKLTVINEAGYQQQYWYDDLGRLIRRQSEREQNWITEEELHYNELGQLEWAKDVAGNMTTFQYDAFGRTTHVNFADGSHTETIYSDAWVFEGATNQIQVIDEDGHRSFVYYDKLGRQTATKVNDMVYYTYDNVGNQTSMTDAKGKTTTFLYDDLNRLVQVKNALNEITSYEYDNVNRLVKTIFPDATFKQQEYDEASRVIRKIDETGINAETFTYDKNGNLDTVVDRKGQSTTYVFDKQRNLLEDIIVTNGIETLQKSFTYNASGQRLTASNENGQFIYHYREDDGSLEQITYPDGRNVTIEDSPVQSWSQLTDPFGQSQYFKYNSRNRLEYVTTTTLAGEKEAQYTYYDNGQLKDIKFANGMATEKQYDETDASRLNSVIHREGVGGNAINTYSYQYDKNHNIQSVSEEVNGEETAFSFSYDALNRIYTSGEHNETYTYDPRGNRKTLETDKPFEIDAVQYHYNLWNELVQVVKEDGTTVSYTYDPDGLLYERTVDAEPTTRYYQFTGQIIAEGEVTPNDSAVLKARYVRGIGLIHREDSLGNKQYYLTNGHGDIVELRGETGGIVNQYDYDIWGNPEILADGVENPFLYSGEYWDQEVELQYLRARWYDPSMGRFINEDTYEGELTNPLSLNLYTYVENNPLIYFDPTGNRKWYTGYVTAYHVNRGFYSQMYDNVASFVDPQTYKNMWNLGQALYNGDITVGQVANAMGKELAAPFTHLYDNYNEVVFGNPSTAQAYSYGQNMANALTNIAAFIGTTAGIVKLINKAPGLLSAISGSNVIKAIPKLEGLAATAIKNDRPIIGILKSDGTIEAYVQPFHYGKFMSHKELGLTKNDLGFGLSYYDGKWSVRGSGYASDIGGPQPTPEQAEMIKKLFGVGG